MSDESPKKRTKKSTSKKNSPVSKKPRSKKKLVYLRHNNKYTGFGPKSNPPKRYYGRKYYSSRYSPLFEKFD